MKSGLWWAVRALLAAVVVFATHSLAGMAVPIHVKVSAPAWAGLASYAVVALALTLAAVRSPWRGLRLGLALSGMAFAVDAVDLADGAAFLTHVGLEPLRLLALLGLASALAVPLWMVLYHGAPIVSWSAAPPVRRAWGKLWRFAACALLYTVLYFAAGLVISPFVRDFYATQTIPSFPRLIALQLLLRGPVLAAICILLTRMVRLDRLPTAIAVAAVFVLLTAVAPLAPPSPFFPDAIRLVHLCEVGTSNFVFALVVGWIWAPWRTGATPAENAAAATPV